VATQSHALTHPGAAPTAGAVALRHFVEERSVRFAKRLGRNVRDNPWPVLGGVLIAIAWVALLRRRRRHREEGSAGALRHWL